MADSNVTILITAIDEASDTFRGVLDSSETMAGKLNKTANTLSELGSAAEDFTKPLAKGLNTSKNAAINFESGMAEVRKTTGLSTTQTAALGDEIKKLSRTIPLTTEQLTEIGVAAGQSGVAMSEIPQYIKDISKASVALAVDTDEAGLAFGRLTNIYGMSNAEIPKLAAAINVLGDTSVASEKEILNVIMRTAALSKQANITAKDSAALGASFVSLGMAPNVAATAINALLGRMTTAEIQSARFQKGLAMIGMSGKELQNLTAEDGTKAIFKLGAALDKLDPQERAKAIGLMFGAEHSDNVGLFLDRMDVFKGALNGVADDQSNVNRYNEVFAAQLDTTASKMQLLNNSFQELAIEIGTALLPAIKAFAAFLTPIINKMTEFAAKHPLIVKLGSALAGLAISIGPLLFGLATLAKAWSLFSAGIPIISKLSNQFLGIGHPISRFLNWLAMGNQRLLGMGKAAEDVKAPEIGKLPKINENLPICLEPIICDGFIEKLKALATQIDYCLPICICPELCEEAGKLPTNEKDSTPAMQENQALPKETTKPQEIATNAALPNTTKTVKGEQNKSVEKGLSLPQIAMLIAALGATIFAIKTLTDSNAGLGEKIVSAGTAIAASLAARDVLTTNKVVASPQEAATDLGAVTAQTATESNPGQPATDQQADTTLLSTVQQFAATQLASAQQAGLTFATSIQEAGSSFSTIVQQAGLTFATSIQEVSSTFLVNAQQTAAAQLLGAQQAALTLATGIQEVSSTFLVNAQQAGAIQLASAQQSAATLAAGIEGIGSTLLAGAQGAGSALVSAGQEAGSLLISGAQQAGAALSGMMEQASAMMQQASATLEATAQQAQAQAQAQQSSPLKTAGMIGLGALGVGGIAFAASKMAGGVLGGLLNTAKGAISGMGKVAGGVADFTAKGNAIAGGAGKVTGGAIATGARTYQSGLSVGKGLGEIAGSSIGGVAKSFGAMKEAARGSGAAVGNAIGSAIEGSQSLGQAASSASSGISGAFGQAGNTIAGSVARVGQSANGAVSNTLGAWGKVQKAAGVTGDAISSAGSVLKSGEATMQGGASIFDKIGGNISGMTGGASDAIGGLGAKAAASASNFMASPASKYILPVAGSVATAGIAGAVASRQQQNAPTPAALPQNQIAPFARRTTTIEQQSAALPTEAPTPAAGLAASAKNNIVPLARSSNASGQAIGSELAKGIEASRPQAELATAGLAQSVSSYLPRSPAEKGPLSDLNKTGSGLTQEFIKGIDGSAIQNKFKDVLKPESKLSELSMKSSNREGSANNSAVYSPTYNLQGQNDNFIAELEKHDRSFIEWLTQTQERFNRGKY